MNLQNSKKLDFWRLCFGQFCAYIHAPSLIFAIPIISYNLAPTQSLATLPIALLTLAMVFSIPIINRLMRRFGRRVGYMIGALLVMLSSIGCFIALIYQSFMALCFFVAISGISGAFAQTYRFAVLELSDESHKGRNVSYLLLGGVLGGFSGPWLSHFFADGIAATPFAASFLALAGVGLISFLVLSKLKFNHLETSIPSSNASSNPTDCNQNKEKFKINPAFLASAICAASAYGVMSLVMTATPVVMHHHHDFSLAATAFVIQSHVVAMFLPSLFTGILIDQFGTRKVMSAGVIILIFCAIAALNGILLTNFWLALVCLGVAWNFLFVAATVSVSRTYANHQRFEAQSSNDLIVFSINALGALSSAWLLSTIGWQMMQYLAILIAIWIGCLIYFTQRNNPVIAEIKAN